MTNEQFEEQCSAYVLKSLDEQEETEFKAYLKTATDAEQKFYKHALNCTMQLSLSVSNEQPSDSVKNSILSKIAERKTPIFKIPVIVYAAAALLLAFFSYRFAFFDAKPIENQLLENGIILISHETQLPKSFCHSAQHINLVSSDGKTESARLIWCDFHKISYLQITQMSDIDTNQSYQIWMTDSEGQAVSLGVIKARENIRDKVYEINHLLKLKPTNKTHFTVTIESENGATQSTAKPYMIST